MKPITKSRTTRNAVVGNASTAGSAYLLISLIRNFVELPWTEDQDIAIASTLTVLFGPLFARVIAKFGDNK